MQEGVGTDQAEEHCQQAGAPASGLPAEQIEQRKQQGSDQGGTEIDDKRGDFNVQEPGQ